MSLAKRSCRRRSSSSTLSGFFSSQLLWLFSSSEVGCCLDSFAFESSNSIAVVAGEPANVVVVVIVAPVSLALCDGLRVASDLESARFVCVWLDELEELDDELLDLLARLPLPAHLLSQLLARPFGLELQLPMVSAGQRWHCH